MRGVHQFEEFNFSSFSKGKDYTVTGLSEWKDYETKKSMGWKVDTAITRDDTQYRTKDDQVISNLFQTQVFKCFEKPDVKVGDIVEPVDIAACTLCGTYGNTAQKGGTRGKDMV